MLSFDLREELGFEKLSEGLFHVASELDHPNNICLLLQDRKRSLHRALLGRFTTADKSPWQDSLGTESFQAQFFRDIEGVTFTFISSRACPEQLRDQVTV